MSITPFILGKGRSGEAIAKSLAIVGVQQPELGLAAPVWLPRGANLVDARRSHGGGHAMLCIANPHALHAQAILDGAQAGFEAILCEKPSCTDAWQLEKLRSVNVPVAILHGYRQSWGVQTLKGLLSEGRLGELITIEGRYWHSSTAERAREAHSPTPKTWKDDPALSGGSDTFIDIAIHWIDAASFLLGAPPARIRGFRSYAGANSPHRDSHVQLAMDFPKGGRALGSISKMVHGAANQFELNLIGTRASATWQFQAADEIVLGEGRERRTLTRKTTDTGARMPPFHGLGWLDGYVDIASRLLLDVYQHRPSSYPRLTDNLDILNAMFKTEWA